MLRVTATGTGRLSRPDKLPSPNLIPLAHSGELALMSLDPAARLYWQWRPSMVDPGARWGSWSPLPWIVQPFLRVMALPPLQPGKSSVLEQCPADRARSSWCRTTSPGLTGFSSPRRSPAAARRWSNAGVFGPAGRLASWPDAPACSRSPTPGPKAQRAAIGTARAGARRWKASWGSFPRGN